MLIKRRYYAVETTCELPWLTGFSLVLFNCCICRKRLRVGEFHGSTWILRWCSVVCPLGLRLRAKSTSFSNFGEWSGEVLQLIFPRGVPHIIQSHRGDLYFSVIFRSRPQTDDLLEHRDLQRTRLLRRHIMSHRPESGCWLTDSTCFRFQSLGYLCVSYGLPGCLWWVRFGIFAII